MLCIGEVLYPDPHPFFQPQYIQQDLFHNKCFTKNREEFNTNINSQSIAAIRSENKRTISSYPFSTRTVPDGVTLTFLAILFRTTGDMGVVGVPFVDSEASALFLTVGVLEAAKGVVVVFVPAAALPFRFTLTTTSASILTSSSKLNSCEKGLLCFCF